LAQRSETLLGQVEFSVSVDVGAGQLEFKFFAYLWFGNCNQQNLKIAFVCSWEQMSERFPRKSVWKKENITAKEKLNKPFQRDFFPS